MNVHEWQDTFLTENWTGFLEIRIVESNSIFPVGNVKNGFRIKFIWVEKLNWFLNQL